MATDEAAFIDAGVSPAEVDDECIGNVSGPPLDPLPCAINMRLKQSPEDAVFRSMNPMMAGV